MADSQRSREPAPQKTQAAYEQALKGDSANAALWDRKGRVIAFARRLPVASEDFLPFRHASRLLTEQQFNTWRQHYVPGHPPGDCSPRFDGLYLAKNKDQTYDSYLRFYPDDIVLTASVSQPNTVEQVAQWFGKNNQWLPRGPYRRLGAQIAFTTVWEEVVVEYVGMLLNDQIICLESYSHATKYREVKWYAFEPASFADG